MRADNEKHGKNMPGPYLKKRKTLPSTMFVKDVWFFFF